MITGDMGEDDINGSSVFELPEPALDGIARCCDAVSFQYECDERLAGRNQYVKKSGSACCSESTARVIGASTRNITR